MTSKLNSLLRRTFMGVAALAAVIPVPSSQAGQVKSSGSNTVLCGSFTGLSVTPGGDISIDGCSASAPTGTGAGTFSLASNGVALPWNYTSTNSFTVSRSGGATGPVNVAFHRNGGCGPLPLSDTLVFADGVTSANIQIKTPNNDTTCKVTLDSATAGTGSTATSAPTLGTAVATVASSSTATISVDPGSGGGGGGGGGAFNCPAKPSDANPNLTLNYGGGTEGFLWLSSGQIGYTTLPLFSKYGGTPQSGSTNVAVAITTGSPTQGTVEISINHCQGVIDTTGQYVQGTTGGKCYGSFPIDQSVRTLPWFETVGSGAAAADAMANLYGICEAYATNGPWYVNVRYNFPDGGTRDMAWQLNWGYYTP